MSTAAEVSDKFFSFYGAIFKALDVAMTESGLSHSKYKLLYQLDERGPLRLTELAEHFAFAPRSITEAVDNLERDGLASREPDPTDRRAKLVSITAQGKAALEATKKVKARVVQQIFGKLDGEQRTQLANALETLLAAATK